jgi:hypothetical protein
MTAGGRGGGLLGYCGHCLWMINRPCGVMVSVPVSSSDRKPALLQAIVVTAFAR